VHRLKQHSEAVYIVIDSPVVFNLSANLIVLCVKAPNTKEDRGIGGVFLPIIS